MFIINGVIRLILLYLVKLSIADLQQVFYILSAKDVFV